MSAAAGHRPLLSGRDADRARDAVRVAAKGFRARAKTSALGPDLGMGSAGVAIVHAALDRVLPGEGHLRLASRSIERAIAATTREPLHPSLWQGFTGIAWALELLQGRAPGEEQNAVDQALPAIVAGWQGSFDLTHGLSGLAVYALERPPHPSVSVLLDALVERLAAASERRAPGVTWRTRPEWSPPSLRTGARSDCDLGVAHGVAGVVAVLGRISASPAATARTRRRARALLDRTVAWLLAQELPRGVGGSFPAFIEPREPRAARTPTRLAWCRGDPGIAAALAVAATCTGERAWLRAATRIALSAAARPFERSEVLDAGLCHGAAGVGHMLHRVHLATGDARIADAARAWLLRAVAMRDDGARYGWNSVWRAGGRLERESGPGLLDGAGGVILALLAATGDADASWDRAFGVSAPERRA